VRLEARLRRWSGTAFRHVPAGSSRGVLDDTYIGRASTNRWNRAGTPAYYFASDVAVIVAEFARHIAVDLTEGARERQVRHLFAVDIRLARVLDLRDPATVDAAGAAPIGTWITDTAITQATASYVRAQSGVQALLVPSVAFLDQPDRFNVVVYRDRIDPAAVFGTPVLMRDLVLEAIGE
jgi:RES domain-containing protein